MFNRITLGIFIRRRLCECVIALSTSLNKKLSKRLGISLNREGKTLNSNSKEKTLNSMFRSAKLGQQI